MGPLLPATGIQSSKNIRNNKYALSGNKNQIGHPLSSKHLISHRSKPFTKAIIEEVTKEHFFTRGSEMAKVGKNGPPTESSFGSPNQGPFPRKFNQRSRSVPGGKAPPKFNDLEVKI